MLWRNRRGSGNILDKRGIGGKTVGIGGLVVGAIVYALMGGNPLDYLAENADQVSIGQSSRSGSTGSGQPGASRNEDEKQFVAVVLADTEDVWNKLFQENNLRYREPKLVLFTQAVQSACGRASSAVGPFYCPADQQIYLDLKFFHQLSRQLGATGDFAAAYVIAHEVGHHIQHLLGVTRGERVSNQVSVQIELQADCLAGVWAKQTEQAKNVIETGDIEEAMNAASAVGDDRLQNASKGQVVPDSFTHGSSAQRVQAFKQGYSGGKMTSCVNLDSNSY